MYRLIEIGKIGVFEGIGSFKNVKKFPIRYQLFYSNFDNENIYNQPSTKLPN